eukprot:4576950-Pleurochrysis_carterae.AAC.2
MLTVGPTLAKTAHTTTYTPAEPMRTCAPSFASHPKLAVARFSFSLSHGMSGGRVPLLGLSLPARHAHLPSCASAQSGRSSACCTHRRASTAAPTASAASRAAAPSAFRSSPSAASVANLAVTPRSRSDSDDSGANSPSDEDSELTADSKPARRADNSLKACN